MNIEIANALSGYIEVLYMMNQKIIKLCGVDLYRNYDYLYSNILDVVQNIPRLVPYAYFNDNSRLELVDKNGLMEFKNEIPYLEQYYLDILSNNYDFLNDVRKIRNKFEHKLHGIKGVSAGSGTTSLFEFEFEVDGTSIEIEAEKIIKLMKELNILFSLITEEILQYSEENNKKDYPYYHRLCRFNFKDFNKIYDSPLLRTFGKLMLDY